MEKERTIQAKRTKNPRKKEEFTSIPSTRVDHGQNENKEKTRNSKQKKKKLKRKLQFFIIL